MTAETAPTNLEVTATDATVVSAVVATADELATGEMKMARVGERRIVVVRTPSGIHALDNACPHQGYGLVTGALDDELLTCQWHNWKFRVSDGVCVRGEENVACHEVTVRNDEIVVTVTEPSDEAKREALWPSLESGIQSQYVGQIARDTARLIEAGAEPAEIVGRALANNVGRTEWGVGHETATAADCLAWAETCAGDDRILPLVQGLAGISEVTRGRPVRPMPAGDVDQSVLAALEAEEADDAVAAVVGALDSGADPLDLRDAFITYASTHHLGYGHGIIYTQKVFELVDRVGPEHARPLLAQLAVSLAWETREEVLPYMRKAMRAMDSIDLDALAATERDAAWSWDDGLIDRLLDADEAPLGAAVEAAASGGGIEGLLDAITIAGSRRLLRHDLDREFDDSYMFRWLDITHVVTMARAARWAWRAAPGPATAQLALFATWLLFDSGRAERRCGIGSELLAQPFEAATSAIDVFENAVDRKDQQLAVDAIAALEHDDAVTALASAALRDGAGSFIVTAHLIKTAQAAAEEAETIGSPLPLLATARLLASPRRERFVSANVAASVDFVNTGSPPAR